jgi:hypothetical protein
MTARRAPARPLIQFSWTRCEAGYQLVEDRKIIIAAGTTWEAIPSVPADIYAIFESKRRTPEGMLDFCNVFGLLRGAGNRPIPTGFNMASYIRVDDMLAEHKRLRQGVRGLQNRDPAPLVHHINIGGLIAQPTLLRRPTGLEMVFIPPDLITFMWLQVAQHAASIATLLRCEHCNTIIPVGAGTGHRSTRRFCNHACQQAAFRKRRSARSPGAQFFAHRHQ